MRLKTHPIHSRSVTSAINSKFHFDSESSISFLSFPVVCFECRAKKNSKNHFDTYRSRRWSFSVILGRSERISLIRVETNAALIFEHTISEKVTSLAIETTLEEVLRPLLQNLPGFQGQIILAGDPIYGKAFPPLLLLAQIKQRSSRAVYSLLSM